MARLLLDKFKKGKKKKVFNFSDETQVHGEAWKTLKSKAMQADFKKSDQYVSNLTLQMSNSVNFSATTPKKRKKSLKNSSGHRLCKAMMQL